MNKQVPFVALLTSAAILLLVVFLFVLDAGAPGAMEERPKIQPIGLTNLKAPHVQARHGGEHLKLTQARLADLINTKPLVLPPGACRLEQDAEGNTVGNCDVSDAHQIASNAAYSPFGNGSWGRPAPVR